MSSVSGASNSYYDAVFTTKTDNAELDQMDYITLMVAEMQNQDFTDPMDNSEMIAQMAQFSNMQMMQQMANQTEVSYAASLVGKTVTASRFTVDGDLDTTTGVIQKISMVDNEYVAYVGGKKYELTQIMSIETTSAEASENPLYVDQYDLETSDITKEGASIQWPVPTEDELLASQLQYSVYYSEEGPFDTVETVEAGTPYGSTGQFDMTFETLSGLVPDTVYYVNVLVEDAAGNKAVFPASSFKTLKN